MERTDRRIALKSVLAFLFASVIVGLAVTSVHAETGGSSTSPPFSGELSLPTFFIEENGTRFEISGSSYLNVTLTSTELVHVFLESGQRMVSYSIESLSSATSTVLTLSGFASNSTYYRYEDGSLTESFTTDFAGGYSYVQDISSRHLLFIVESITTIYIQSDGSVYPANAPILRAGNVYTLTADVYESIIVAANDIIVDGNGHTLQGLGDGWGFLVYDRNNVTIRNAKITQFWLGIYFWWTHNSRIENVTATNMEGGPSGPRGIALYGSHNNTIIGNQATNNDYGGIYLLSSLGNTISGNNASNNDYMGIWIYQSAGNTISGNNAKNNGHTGIGISYAYGNTVSGNNVSNNGYTWFMGGIGLYWAGPLDGISGNMVSGNNVKNNYGGILVWASNENTIYHNNFIDNLYNVNNWASVNTWDDGYPSGGNYWSDYDGVDLYSGPDQNQPNSDGIGDTPYTKWGIVDRYPFVREGGWEKCYLAIETEPSGIVTILGEGWYDQGTDVSLTAPTIVPDTTGIQYRFDHWTVDEYVVSGNPITVRMDGPHIAKAFYVKQYYLAVLSPYDTAGGEGWYDEGETAYATLQVGLEYDNGVSYGFVCWSGDAGGLDVISNPIGMNSPKTAIANWEESLVYGDVRTIGFWKHQVNVWYFTELMNDGLKIRGIGTAQVSEDELIAHLEFINGNSNYFTEIVVFNPDESVNKLDTLRNAYNILKTPMGTDSIKMRAEQQLLAVWLNLARQTFFWNTQLSQDTQYLYHQYNFEGDLGLISIGETVKFCEAELVKLDGNYEAAKNICDSINNDLGIIWGT